MAEIISCVQVAIQLLDTLIKSQESLYVDLRSEVESIINALTSCSAYLSSQDRRADENDLLKDWVRRVRILAHGIEDVIEEYYLLEKEKSAIGYVIPQRYLKWRSIATEMKSLHSMATEIFHLMSPATSSHFYTVTPQQGVTGRLNMAEDSDLVRGDTAKTDLIKMLRLHEFEDSGLSTIAVTGMTGLVKTAIVGSVYNDALVRDFLPIRAWISLSQPYNYENILKIMFKQFRGTAQLSEQSSVDSDSDYTDTKVDNWIDSLDVGTLEKKIKIFLYGKRYIVVFNDVQEGNTRLATDIKSVLRVDDNKGSKLVITTRFRNVARTWIDGSNHGLYKLKPLPYHGSYSAREPLEMEGYVRQTGNT